MRFLVDAQLPPALARFLTEQGHLAEHVADIGLRHAEDSPIWHYALDHQAVLVTKDEDFPHRLRQGPPAPVIVWLRIGNTSAKPCWSGSNCSFHKSSTSSIRVSTSSKSVNP